MHEAESIDSDASFEKRRVWDIPTRLFHWALVGTVVTGLWLGEYRGFETITLHFYFGYATAALLGFRIIWGIFGPKPARLSSLVSGPKRLLSYASTLPRRKPSGTGGHNPIGALSVIAMLVALLVQITTGLFSEDDGLFAEGPFAEYVSDSTVLTMTSLHHTTSRVILALIAIHVAAILFYLLWKRENLIKPMISGWKWVKRDDTDTKST